MATNKGRRCRLVAMFSLTFGFFLVEIVVGYLMKSNALVADSFHMLSDVGALIIAYFAVKMAPMKWKRNTFGWARAEILGSLVNSVFLLALCFTILVESIQRFVRPEAMAEEDAFWVLIVGALGLLVNLIGLCLFHEGHGHSHGSGHRHSHDRGQPIAVKGQVSNINSEVTSTAKTETVTKSPSFEGSAEESFSESIHSHKHSHGGASSSNKGNMNMRGVFLHLLADALGSIIVVVSALVIIYTDWSGKIYIDSVLSCISVFLILNSSLPLLQDSALILLQTVPEHLQIEELESKLLKEIPGIVDVHEFHIWQLAGERIIATCHFRVKNLVDYRCIAEKAKEFFHNHGIHSTTIQPEFWDGEVEGEDCALLCPGAGSGQQLNGNPPECLDKTCCGPVQPEKEEDGTDAGSNNNKTASGVRRNSK